MEMIAHRVNTLEELRSLPLSRGAEVDIRTFGSRLVLNHEPKQDGPLLDDWLGEYRHGTLILNVKEDGLEQEILQLLTRHSISQAFFLDQTVPASVALARRGEHRFAVRYSEFEPLEGALKFAGQARWCWLDCFTHLPMELSQWQQLKASFKLCLVSPELQGHDPREAIPVFKMLVKRFPVDAVCTDFPDLWA